MPRSAFTERLHRINESLDRVPSWIIVPLGFGLIILGFFGFLPILGFWMIPLGLLILSRHYRWARYYFHKINRKLHSLGKRSNRQ